MIDTEEFLDHLVENGFDHICVVPCSFAKHLINAAINHPHLQYIPAASEAVACSIAAGLKMSGGRPIVVIQSSGLTNMGSCITSLLKPYDIHIPIITSWRTYKPGDSEIQHEHLATALPELIEAYGYQPQVLDDENIDTAVAQIIECNSSKIILILKAGTFSSVALDESNKLDLSSYLPRSAFLSWMNNYYSARDHVFIGTTGNTAREMYTYMPDTNNFYMAGNMGGALSIGLGAYLNNRHVIVCGGDAEMVMHLGGITTAGRYRMTNGGLLYILFDNESNKSTGGQQSYQQHINYQLLARSCNLEIYDKTVLTLDDFANAINTMGTNASPCFIHVKCSYDELSPRPPATNIRSSIDSFKHNEG